MDGLKEALSGPHSSLDGWLECHSEAEVRAAILALIAERSERELRDHFAAKALPAVFSNIIDKAAADTPIEVVEMTASLAYMLADAMLKAREQ